MLAQSILHLMDNRNTLGTREIPVAGGERNVIRISRVNQFVMLGYLRDTLI